MVERTNQQWLDDLRAKDERQALALTDLRALPYALAGKLDSNSPEFARI